MAINSIKINSVTREIRAGRSMWLKRRKPGSELIAISANLFFRLTGARIRVRVNSEEWQHWEVSCFRLLHGRGFRAFAEGLRTVCADKVPGRSLVEYLNQGSFTPRLLEAAARELRRAHQLWSGEFDNLWSHGDPHLGNVIYDKAADRARLIDFEAPHAKSLPAVVRQADDLLVFLQDMGGRVSAEQWLPFALDFLNTYDRPEVVTELREHLTIPGGLPGLWWKLRSHYLPRTELISRFAALKRALAWKWQDGGRHAISAERGVAKIGFTRASHQPKPHHRLATTSARPFARLSGEKGSEPPDGYAIGSRGYRRPTGYRR